MIDCVKFLREHRGSSVKRYLKIFSGLVLFVILALNVSSISRWTETRGVNDDFCYLRQAHLFQKFGLGGLDTNIAQDDEQYLSAKMKETDLLIWKDPMTPPCHVQMPATNKLVIQYPPGTGFILALFPSGHQVIPLFVLANVAIFGVGLLAIARANTSLSILLTAVFADVAVYLMINPTKASYSMAPTMVVCALAGLLTPRLFGKTLWRDRLLPTFIVGFLIGLAVNFRLANLFLSAGYFLFFLVGFLRSRKLEAILDGALFGGAFLVGIMPTIFANAINAGSPFSTTYGTGDVAPPEFNVEVIWSYVMDLQFILLLLAGVWTALLLRRFGGGAVRQVALVTAGNLLVNVGFFFSHPVFTPYYMVPIAMLSLWGLLFASLMPSAEAAKDKLVAQAATAQS
jgi:hypothetical protein